MEFCGSQTVSHYYKNSGEKPTESSVRGFFVQLLAGVKFLHENQVFHRDLKIENILVTSKKILKIIDFGLAVTSNELTNLMCGTPAYFSPQVMSRQLYTPKAVDIWCLGIILFRLLFQQSPFGGRLDLILEDKLTPEVKQNVIEAKISFPDVPFSASFRRIVLWILQKSETNRPSIDAIMSHEWMVDC